MANSKESSRFTWSEEETLIYLVGHLRGCALQELNLLGEDDRFGSQEIAAQEFCHCSQVEGEKVGDYIRHLEKKAILTQPDVEPTATYICNSHPQSNQSQP